MPNYFNYGYNPYTTIPNGYYPMYGNSMATPPAQYPMQQATQPAMQHQGQIKWITSEKEVDEQYVGPNEAIVMWNANEPVIYLKEADATGKPSVEVYDLVKRVPPKPPEDPVPNYATADEFAKLVGVVSTMSKSVEDLAKDFDTIKTDMYGVAGRKRASKRNDGEDDG